MKCAGIMLSMLAVASICGAEVHVVDQANKKFSVNTLTINAGDTVEFTNQDNFNHNVFSLSGTKPFDLGSYPKGESKSVIFDRAGVVEVECAIHSDMRMTIIVVE